MDFINEGSCETHDLIVFFFFVFFNVYNFVLFDQFVLKSKKVGTLVMNDDDDVIRIVLSVFATKTIHDNDVMVCTSFVLLEHVN